MGVAARAASLLIAAALFAACNGEPEPEQRPSPTTGATSPAPESPPPSPDVPQLLKVGTFDDPVHVAAPRADERIFVVEQQGVVKIVKGSEVKTFIDIRGDVGFGGERGLFSIAFSPNYGRSGLAYLSYTDKSGDSRIVEYKVSGDPGRLDPGTRREILLVKQPFANHNGGLILFDPKGMLMIGLGDGGSGGDPQNRAQNLGDLLGKLLRIDPSKPSGGRPYGIPSDNPFVGRDKVRPEIWAYGLRNPWRFSFDPRNKDLYVADVGQNRFEEINWVPPDRQAGANYGWRAFEGVSRFTDDRIDESRLITPVLTYPTGPGGTCAVTGGGIYRGEVNTLRDLYLYADYCEGVVKAFRIKDSQAADQQTLNLRADSISSFGTDSKEQMYVISKDGDVFRIART